LGNTNLLIRVVSLIIMSSTGFLANRVG
jgi:hypothetical protein